MAVANAEVMDWLRSQDIEELMHDFPGMEMLHKVWLAEFPASNDVALSSFLSSLSSAEEAAFSQLFHRRGPDGTLEEARHVLAAIHQERLKHLIRRARFRMKDPLISPEQLNELHEQVMEWNRQIERRF